MKKYSIDPTLLTARQITEMINLLIHMLKHLGHKIDFDIQQIDRFLSKKDVFPYSKKKEYEHMKCLLDQIEILKNSIEKM